MKYLLMIALAITTLVACNAEAKSKKPLKTSKDSLSYSFGIQWGNTLLRDSIQVDVDILADGLKDALTNKEKSLTEAKTQEILQALVMKLQEKHQKEEAKMKAEFDKKGQSAKLEGEQYLANNKNQPDVKVTASGLQYKIINPGNANKPTANSTVSVHYAGKFIDGKVFDSSYERKEPVEFPLNGVIPGWTEGLQLIGEGGKMMLYIPYNLAYGEAGMSPVIPGYSALVFEVELLKIVK